MSEQRDENINGLLTQETDLIVKPCSPCQNTALSSSLKSR